jgi:DNA-binding FadR family transcriptional regulator
MGDPLPLPATGGRRRRGEKVYEAVARDIVRRIAANRVPPGAVLPSEAQMLEDYDVGRGSLREALRVLEVHGLIAIKPGPGGGPVVAGVSSRDFGRMATLYFQVAGATYRELTEARLVVEPMMARLAAQRRDDAKLRELEAVIARSRGAELHADAAYVAAATDFHGVVAGISGNRILDLMGRSLKDLFTDRIHGTLFPVEDREHIFDVHAAIARAILRGDATRSERLMREHMEDLADSVQKRHPGLMDEVVDWR